MPLSEAQLAEKVEDLEGQKRRAAFEMERLRKINGNLMRENTKLRGKLVGRHNL